MKYAVAFDTETKGLDWWNPDQRAFLVSWADAKGEYVAPTDDESALQPFYTALDRADIIIGHNLSFDVHQLRETLGIDIMTMGKELWDTDLMSRYLRPEGAEGTGFGHGLKPLAALHLDPSAMEPEEHIKEMAKKLKIALKGDIGAYYQIWRAYPEVMEKYAAMDARYTYDLWAMFMKEVPKYQRVADLENEVMPWIIEAERIGVRVDQKPVLRLKREYEKEARRLHESLAAQLGEEALGGEGSKEALKEALLSNGVPLYRLSKTGQLETNKFALSEFADDFPVIQELFDWRQANKFLSTYIEPMIGREVVHTNFAQIGAWTGRMASRRPNMQNIPNQSDKSVREAFIPREGYAFVVSDYDSIEARVLAYYLGPKGRPYADKLAQGFDVHAEMAAAIAREFGEHDAQMELFLKTGDRKDERDKAKNTTYAITYGAGARRVTDMNKLDHGRALTEKDWKVRKGYAAVGDPSYEPAKKLIGTIKATIPGFVDLEKRVKTKVETHGHVNTIIGRKNVVNPDKSYVGLNALIQGTAAEIMKMGFVAVAKAIQPYGGRVLLVVHDECVSEVPIEVAEEVLPIQNEAMTSVIGIHPPLAVSGTITTKSYADAK
jgi:DNA polymerase-1